MNGKKWHGMLRFLLVAGALLWSVGPVSAEPERIMVLTTSDLSVWEEKSFQGRTEYEVIDNGIGPVVRAVSKGSASGLFRKMTVDLQIGRAHV